ncbi:MAG: ATP-binding protein [Bacilli bacterium]|nr:ATP-binding protein [Bacilli bacterium]
MKIVGRKEEIKIINDLLESENPEFLAIYGRRRVGKTFLVNATLKERFTFSHAGLSPNSEEDDAKNMDAQLAHFYNSLKQYGSTETSKPKNWLEAFHMLSKLLREKENGEKQVIFLDELPWMDTPRSNFMQALEGFWNTYLCSRNVLLVSCGSAISWMNNKLINNHGGLYGRVTRLIDLKPFGVKECKEYFDEKGVYLSEYDVIQSYMIFGGIPYYLNYFTKEKSLSQNVDDLFFGKNAILKDEYNRLFTSIFTNPRRMEAIVRTLSKKNIGLTRSEICQKIGVSDNGSLSKELDSLILCSFVEKYAPFGESKNNPYYKLIDPFCKFYLEFIDEKTKLNESFWTYNLSNQRIVSWRGFAFENFCFLHTKEIKAALGISGINSSVSSYYKKGSEEEKGAQIDMIIERADNVVNLCEMKYYGSEFVPTKENDLSLRNKVSALSLVTKKKSVIRNVLITTFGIAKNAYSSSWSNAITIEDFFK